MRVHVDLLLELQPEDTFVLRHRNADNDTSDSAVPVPDSTNVAVDRGTNCVGHCPDVGRPAR